jgi:predicted nucleic acid-binding protein
MAYVDTSLLVACYCAEPLSRKADRAVRESAPPAISPLVEVEFCSALALKTRVGQIDAASATRILAALRLHLEEKRFRIVPIEAKEYALACDWIGRFAAPLRTVDALHLAAAFSAGLPILTADKGLACCAKRFGVAQRLIA